MKSNIRIRVSALTCASFFWLVASVGAAPAPQAAGEKFEVSFPASAHAGAITGRVFVVVSTSDKPEPRLQAGNLGDSGPFFGVDVNALAPEQAAVIDTQHAGVTGAKFARYSRGRLLRAGDDEYLYRVSSRGWAHRSGRTWISGRDSISSLRRGIFIAKCRKCTLDPAAGYDIKLSLTKVIPPVQVPADTAWVKHIKIQSEMLTKFWGHPMYIGAIVLLPKGYDEHPNAHYPVIYEEGHFSLRPPFRFTEENPTPIPGDAGAACGLNMRNGIRVLPGVDFG